MLTIKVDLSDGTNGFVFSRNPHRNEAKMFSYNCHICSVPNLPGERCLYTHISGRRHQQKLTLKPFDSNLFRAPLHRTNKSMSPILSLNHITNFQLDREASPTYGILGHISAGHIYAKQNEFLINISCVFNSNDANCTR